MESTKYSHYEGLVQIYSIAVIKTRYCNPNVLNTKCI